MAHNNQQLNREYAYKHSTLEPFLIRVVGLGGPLVPSAGNQLEASADTEDGVKWATDDLKENWEMEQE